MTVHARIRQLAQTPGGRAHLHAWSGCPADKWQVAFELAGDFAKERAAVLGRDDTYLPAGITFASPEWYAHRAAQFQRTDDLILAELEAAHA